MLFEERDRAESFGAVAEQYDRARPTHPRELIDADRAGRSFELLSAGQSWHWVQPFAGAQRAAEALNDAHGWAPSL